MNLDLIANAILYFNNWPIILPISIVSALILGRIFFFQTICLVSFNIVVNAALKGLFKIPLSPTLHKLGYSFPSGHMQLVTVFYIWIALYFPFRTYRQETQ